MRKVGSSMRRYACKRRSLGGMRSGKQRAQAAGGHVPHRASSAAFDAEVALERFGREEANETREDSLLQ